MSAAAPTALAEPDLRAALAGIERPLLREWSVKATPGDLRAGRFLVSFPRRALGPGPRRVLAAICARLGAPGPGWAVLARHQSAAVSVHFGYQPSAGARPPVVKCYLEFAPESRPEPDLVFLALKWRGDGAQALAHYRTRDHLAAAAQHALLDAIVPPGVAHDTLHALIEFAPGQEGLRLLEVEEPGSPRRSLDLNLSGCRQTLGDRAELLSRLLGADEAARAYLAPRASDALGHVAAGFGRDGLPFATLYHGARRVFGDL